MNNEKKVVERNYALDFLKVIGTMLIFFHHYQQVTGAYFSEVNFYCGRFDFAYIVELFFLLSGYFMYSYEDKIKEGLDFKTFFGKRASRLLPIVAVSAVAFNLVNRFYRKAYGINWLAMPMTLWGTITTSLGITEGWGLQESYVNYPTWYISALLLTYCVFYFIVYIAKRCKIPTEYMYIVMICIGMGGLTYSMDQTFLTFGTSRAYYSFFYGILLKKYIDNKGISKKMIWISSIIAIIMPIMIANDTAYMTDGINYMMTYFFYPAIIILLHTDVAKKIFKWKFIGKLSEISYNVYVWHLLILIVLISANRLWELNIQYNNVFVMIASLIVSFIVGTLSHYFIEKPINRYIDKNYFKK